MIGVDTHVLIWGLKRKATPNRIHMIPRAEQLLDDAVRSKDRIMVPSLVLSEFLVEYTPEQRAEVLAEMRLRFFVADFNFRAAAIAANLYAYKEVRNAARDASGSTKQCIKVDISILATAEAHQPKVFFAEDGPLLEIAKRMRKYLTVDVQQMPAVRSKQADLGFNE